ncbi:MAG: heme lyase CcmF/NrfE family subunit [Deltaproteobacteria bacterium]|nr:MAG: heme lyase CcmF/NrfE family subunit [Deltaproteobacteria bacterium]
MTEIGFYSLVIAFLLAGYSALTSIWGVRCLKEKTFAGSKNAAAAVFGFLTLASMSMIYALVTRDFQVEYVARYTNRSLPMIYTLTAFYAGQEGSLLFWAWLLSIFAAIVIFQNRKKNLELLPYVLSVLMTITFFFILLMVFVTSPFKTLSPVPFDGQGLNPMLQNPGMIFHPPALFIGYVGFSVPFAFAIAALITGQLGNIWIRTARKWTIFSWLFLTVGNLLGAQWAYVELGWGGYWAWDPVENASLMPWLIGTAYLHSVMIQEKRDMLKVWNILLIIFTFLLTIFGTFITRSGVLSSVHSFGQSSLGWLFLIFLGIVLVISFNLLIYRLPELRSRNQMESLLSKESSFLYNNLLLVGIAFAILLGTLFPVISEAISGVKITVGAPFFNAVVTPIALALLLLTGVCPFIAWRKSSLKNFLKKLLSPSIFSIIGAIVLYVLGIRSFYALVSFALCIFALATLFLKFLNGTGTRHILSGEGYPKALWNLVARNKRRYGGYIIHLGVVLIFVAISGGDFNMEKQITLKKGESFDLKGYTLRYDALTSYPTANKHTVAAILTLFNGGHKVGVLAPEKSLYTGQDQLTTDVAIYTTLKEDLYVILAGYDKDGATFKVMINPLVVWLWIGGGVMAFGAAIAMLPDRRKRRETILAEADIEKEIEEEISAIRISRSTRKEK